MVNRLAPLALFDQRSAKQNRGRNRFWKQPDQNPGRLFGQICCANLECEIDRSQNLRGWQGLFKRA
jgi:hypothetical protein